MLTNQQPFFNPKFTHQVFHRDETIKGMKDLSVTIFLSPSTLKPYVYWCCSDYGQQYDDVTNILKLSFGSENLFTNRESFIKFLQQEQQSNFILPGKLIATIKKNVSVNQYQSQKSIIAKPTLFRQNKSQNQLLQEKCFNIVKIKGDSDYFKKIDRTF